ncbi:hypothetical protein C8R47DRAFT_1145929 [Mycena vitilis]|nr:hypothetical protein C8R47DRAFT_1145929 [Mycena vitilis]
MAVRRLFLVYLVLAAPCRTHCSRSVLAVRMRPCGRSHRGPALGEPCSRSSTHSVPCVRPCVIVTCPGRPPDVVGDDLQLIVAGATVVSSRRGDGHRFVGAPSLSTGFACVARVGTDDEDNDPKKATEILALDVPHSTRWEYLKANLLYPHFIPVDFPMPLLGHLDFGITVEDDDSISFGELPSLRTVILDDAAIFRVVLPWKPDAPLSRDLHCSSPPPFRKVPEAESHRLADILRIEIGLQAEGCLRHWRAHTARNGRFQRGGWQPASKSAGREDSD